MHWGLSTSTSVNRRAGVTPQIGLTTLTSAALRFADARASYSWSGGTPTASSAGTTTGIFFRDIGNGFQLTVPADTSPRTLKLYVGGWRAQGRLEATLSDGSAAPYILTLVNSTAVFDRQVTLDYQAASAGQTLTVRYVLENNFGQLWGNVSISGATLVMAPVNQAPVLAPIADQSVTEGESLSIPVSASDSDGPLPLILSESNSLPGNPTILVDNGDGTGTLSWTPAIGDAAASPYSVTVTATDGAGAAADVTFSIAVNAQGANPPVIDPIEDQAVVEGDLLSLLITASDTDGPPPLVLSQINTLPGNPSILIDNGDGTGTLSWTPAIGDASGSPYTITVTATDGAGNSANLAFSIFVFPQGGGPFLSGTEAALPSSVNLSAEGTTDWVHWGLSTATSVNRLAGVTPQIGLVGLTTAASRFSDARAVYAWNNGTPTASTTGTTTGIFFRDIGNGFQLTVPADTSPRTLKLYVGGWRAQGRLEATLSDGSAAPYILTLVNSTAVFDRQVTLDYQAASAGQTLTVRYVLENNFGQLWGNVSISGATLVMAPVNHPPVFSQPSYAFAIPEDAGNGAAVGTVAATDPDAGDTVSYSLLDDAGSVFAINAQTGAITVANAAALDFETTPGYSLQVRASDSQAAAATVPLTISITNVNEPPAIVSTPVTGAIQNTAYSYDVDAADPDSGAVLSYSLDAAPAGMVIHAGTGVIAWTPGPGDAGSHAVTVRVTDNGGLFDTQSFTLVVAAVNEPPTDIQLSNAAVAENAANGTAVGTLSTTDPNAGDTHAYGLVDDAGGRFAIGGAADNEIVVANGALLNFEAASTHSIVVRATDSGANTFDKQFVITVDDVNEAPVFGLSSYAFAIPENSSNGAAVGTVAATDPDAGDTVSYSLLDDAGSVFAINAQTGAITVANAAALDFETTPGYSLQVRASDSQAAAATVPLTITVTNVNETPVLAPIGPRSVTAGQTLAFTVTADDPDAGDTPQMTVSALPGAASYVDNGNGTGSFSWTPSAGDVAGSPYAVTFTATDSGLLSDAESVSITVNEPPTGILIGDTTALPSSMNLSAEGTADWVHWGLSTATSVNRRAGVTPQIGLTTLTSAALRFADARASYSWSGGTPTASSAGTTTGIFFRDIGNGFQLTVPADTSPRTLKLYVGGWRAQGRLEATLSDGSAAPYILTLVNSTAVFDRQVTLDYQAASAGQTLTVRYVLENNFGQLWGNVSISGATLVENPLPVALPYTDDFSDGDLADWVIVDDAVGATSSWSVQAGRLQQDNIVAGLAETYRRGTYAYLAGGWNLADYRFSADLAGLSSATGAWNDIGVKFRYQDNDNYYRFSMNSRTGFSRLEKKVAGVFTPLAVNARGYVAGQTHTFTIDADGSLIQVSVGGDPLFAVNDSSLATGTVGLYTQGRATFDNVVIETPTAIPTVTLAAPAAATVVTTDTLAVSAIATHVPVGGGVEFLLDGVTSILDETFPYAANFTGVSQGDHTVEAIVRGPVNEELARDTNTLIGVQGEYFTAIGDSHTNGSGDFYSADNQTPRLLSLQGFEPNLVELLEGSLGKPVMVYNEGIGGDESVDTAFNRISSILARHPGSSRALVLLGTNDALQTAIPSGSGCVGSACDGTYKGNMQSLIDTLTNAGKTVYVALVPPVFGFSTPFSNPTTASVNTNYVQPYNAVINTELTNRQLGPDLYAYFLDAGVNRFSLFSDTLHFNALGYTVLAALWHNALNPGSPVSLPFVLGNLSRSTVSPYLKQNLLESGNTYYVDAAYTLTDIPPVLAEGRWVMTANADKASAVANSVSFDVDRAVTVYIAYDAGAASRPDWMSAYTDTGLTVTTTDPLTPILSLYSLSYGAGTITLGGNLAAGASGADSNYVAVVVPE